MSKEEQRKNILSIPSVNKSVEESLQTPFFSLGEWPQERWWKIFNAQQLNDLIDLALSQNPSIQTVEKRIEFAKQTAKVTRSQLFPLLFFDAQETYQYLSKHGLYRKLNPTIPLKSDLIDLTLAFTYEFDFWGKNAHLFHAAIGKEKAEKAETAQVTLITTTALAQAYFALKTNLLRKRLYKDLVRVANGYFQLQVLLQEKALFSKLPPLFSAETLLEVEKQLIHIEEEVATDRHLLNILVGRGPDEPIEVDDSLPPLPKSISIPDNLSIDLLARRPDLMAQIWRVEAISHEVGAAMADFYPNINIRVFGGLESTLYSLLFQGTSKTFGLQPALHLPIFTAGAIRANVRAKKALFDQAVYDYNNLLLKSTQEVADLLVLAQSIFEQKVKQQGIVENAKERFELTVLRQEKGLDNMLETYRVEEELIQKQLADVVLLYSQYLATVRLIKAFGGGYLAKEIYDP